MKQFDVLSRDLKVKDRYFLEASAGTGKTFAIEHLVSRLILEGINLEEILIVTFTRAATRDLKQRVIRNLYKIIDQIEKQERSSFDYVNALLDQDEEIQFNGIIHLKKAIQSQHFAQIFTIHGFCYRMLKEFAFDADVHFNLMDPDEGSPKSVYIELIMHTLRTAIDEKVLCVAQLDILMNSHKKDLSKLVQGLLPMLDGYKNIGSSKSFIEYLEIVNRLIPRMMNSFSFEMVEVITPFYKEITSLDKQLKEEFKQQLAYFKSVFAKGSVTKEELIALMAFERDLFSFFTIENRKKNNKPQEGILTQMEKLEEALIDWNRLFEQMKDPLRIQLCLANICKCELERRLLEKDLILTDRLLDQMLVSMKQERFCLALKNKYKGVIIDEFQDTDPKQWEIFKTLFFNLPSLEMCCLVGDPKQSIYAFRNADLKTYFIAKNSFPKEKQFALGVNFRSTSTLVEGLNLLFEKAPKWLDYYHVESFFGTEGEKEVPICFFGSTFPKSKRGKLPSREVEEEYYFSYMAKEIIRLQKEGIAFHDQVILVKDRFQARDMERFLRRVNIPVVSNAKVSLSESPIFLFMERVFLLLMNPYDINLLKQLLSIGIIPVETHLLEADLSNPLIQEAVAFFQLLKKMFYEEGMGAVCKQLLESSIIKGFPSLQEGLISFDNLDLYNDMMQLLQLLMESSPSFHYGLFDVVEFFARLKRKSIEEDKTFFRKPSKEGSCVTIMTTFTSKGLEYAVVFAYGLISRSFYKKSFYYSPDKQQCLFLKEDDKDIEQLMIANDQEKLRQLYVALTRAKTKLYIPFCFESEKSELKVGDASALELFYSFILLGINDVKDAYALMNGLNQQLLKELVERYPDHFSFEVLKGEEETNILSEKMESPVLTPPPKIALSRKLDKTFSFSSLALMNDNPIENKQVISEMPYGAEVGSLIHLVFEKIIQNGWHKESFKQQRTHIIHKLLKGTVLNDWLGDIDRLIDEVLHISFPQGFSLSELDPSFMLQEVEFLYTIKHQNKMKGFVDLLFRHDGKYFIVDWKTNTLPSYSKEEMEKEMHRHHYFSQGAIYAEALRKYLNIFEEEFDQVFGGVHYFFLRGPALYSFFPKDNQLNEVLAWIK